MFTLYKNVTYTSAQVLSIVNQQEVLEFYLNISIQFHSLIKSPIRTDPNPGCRFKVESDGNIVMFDCSRGKAYRMFQLIAEKLNIDYFEAKDLIVKNFITNKLNIKPKLYLNEFKERQFELNIKKDNFNKTDFDLFTYNDIIFTEEIFNKYNIIKVSVYKINQISIFHTAYIFNHKNFKQIYRPDLAKDGQGYLGRYRGDTMLGLHDFNYNYSKPYSITTKSFLDAVLLDLMGVNVRFVLKEGHNFTETELESYNPNAKNFLLYDNDKTGIENANKYLEHFKLIFYETEKDTKDNIIRYSSEQTKINLLKLINKKNE